MKLNLPDGEPFAGPWRPEPLGTLVRLLEPSAPKRSPYVIAVDGRSASGKSTLAAALGVVMSAAVVHTDDVAWHHSFFGWTDLLLKGVLGPARAGQPVSYRPPAWGERGREGAIVVPEGCAALIVEGVGAARRELTHVLDKVVWVQSDFEQARTRGVARDGGDARAEAFWDEWMAAELPFLAAQKPWERADVVVLGTPNNKRLFRPGAARSQTKRPDGLAAHLDELPELRFSPANSLSVSCSSQALPLLGLLCSHRKAAHRLLSKNCP